MKKNPLSDTGTDIQTNTQAVRHHPEKHSFHSLPPSREIDCHPPASTAESPFPDFLWIHFPPELPVSIEILPLFPSARKIP